MNPYAETSSEDIVFMLQEEAKVILKMAVQAKRMEEKLDSMQKEIENMKIKWEK